MAWNPFLPPAVNVASQNASVIPNPIGAKSRYTDMTSDQFMDMYPAYTAAYDPSMAIGQKVKDRFNAVPISDIGLRGMRAEATRRGPSAWARLAELKSLADERNARERGAAEVAGQTAQARSGLAMRGGLTGGAAERIATAGQKNFLDMSADSARTGDLGRMGIGMQDEQNRQGMMGKLAGAENQMADLQFRRADALSKAESDDLQRQIEERNRQNQFNMQKYGVQGQVFGSEKTAQAMEHANSGASWICTALASKGHTTPTALLRALRRQGWREHPELTRLYLSRGHVLVERMEKAGYDWKQLGPFHRELKQLLAEGKEQKALKLFMKTVKTLWQEFWPDCDSPLYLAARGGV